MSIGPGRVVLSTDLPGAIKRRQGKVRDIYEYEDGLLIVASDRISAFDVVMPTGIPDKGKILTQVSVFWFERTRDIVDNHLLSTRVDDFPAAVQEYGDILEGRAMWCRKAQVVPVECVVRGYLTGAAWRAYQAGEPYCGHRFPPGMVEAQRLPEPIFTPTSKAETGHDEPMDREQCAQLVGEQRARELEELSLRLFQFASAHAEAHGLLLADTKFEFGEVDGKLILIDELLTPDSSRYWDAAQWEPGKQPVGFDKQYLRDWLETLDWDKTPPGPELPGHVVARTRELYLELMRRLTGREP